MIKNINNEPCRTVCWVLLFVLMCLLTVLFRPIMPVDETRYLSVAWEMWHHGNFLVPYADGVPYSQKPPLLFYLIHVGWAIFGVNEWSARLTGPFFALLDLFLTARLARLLWPGRDAISLRVPFVLLAFPIWAVFSTLTMFDMVLTFFILLTAFCLVKASKGGGLSAWTLSGFSIGAAILTKGPVIFIFILPLGFLAPWWLDRDRNLSWMRWYSGFGVSLLVGIAVAMAWIIPAAMAGGPAYVNAVLRAQLAGRVIKSFAHSRPVWWYLELFPLIFFPWIFLPDFLKGFVKTRWDEGIRFCLSAVLPPILILSVASCKQIHYLIPALPFAALLVTRLMLSAPQVSPGRIQWPVSTLFIILGLLLILVPYLSIGSTDVPDIKELPMSWGIILLAAGALSLIWKPSKQSCAIKAITVSMAFMIVFLHAGPLRELAPAFDISTMAEKISDIQKKGGPVAVYPRKYSSQFQFQGRLEKPLAALTEKKAIAAWARENPGGYVVIFFKKGDGLSLKGKPVYVQRFKGKWMGLWKAADLDRPEGSMSTCYHVP